MKNKGIKKRKKGKKDEKKFLSITNTFQINLTEIPVVRFKKVKLIDGVIKSEAEGKEIYNLLDYRIPPVRQPKGKSPIAPYVRYALLEKASDEECLNFVREFGLPTNAYTLSIADLRTSARRMLESLHVSSWICSYEDKISLKGSGRLDDVVDYLWSSIEGMPQDVRKRSSKYCKKLLRNLSPQVARETIWGHILGHVGKFSIFPSLSSPLKATFNLITASLHQALHLLLLMDLQIGRLAQCERPDCPYRPFFITTGPKQQFCSSNCVMCCQMRAIRKGNRQNRTSV